jgi:ComF family protein
MKFSMLGVKPLLDLLYPRLCFACNQNTPPDKTFICISCQYKLPETDFHKEKENPFTERFWGRIPLFSGAALYHFVKGGRAQHLIHHFKYRGKKEIGIRIGELYGNYLKDSPLFNCAEVIVPVPLHPKKKHQRGFNQSEMFARGLAKSMAIPYVNALSRVIQTDTQTQKSRMDRFDNVVEAFRINNHQDIRGKHILLVDDVITTGATLEACSSKLLSIAGTTISMATIAIAN